jgi:hypothetical protein
MDSVAYLRYQSGRLEDIYVTNDYAAGDLLYINNKNGTFSDQACRFKQPTGNG